MVWAHCMDWGASMAKLALGLDSPLRRLRRVRPLGRLAGLGPSLLSLGMRGTVAGS
jgi:hypothetical protein